MDKVYRKYREVQRNPQKLMDELGIDINEGDSLGMGVVRKETDLNNDEKHFLLAVERGDIPTARHFMEESQIYFNLNINCVDPLGRTALLISIENENIEMMQLLLSYNVELGDALLHAISEENVEAVELLLIHLGQQSNKKDLSKKVRTPLKRKDIPETPPEDSSSEGTPSKRKDAQAAGFLGGVPSSSFTPDITPIILAAHRDNYEIIKILLDRGDRIPKPHDVRCSCTDCVTKSNEDSLNHSRSRINAYRALSSPSLISLSSKDPILTAFELSWELKRMSRLENEFKLEYENIANLCQDFAVDLLDQTRGSKELEVILNHDPNGPVADNNERVSLARLRMAIKYKQKRFVAHPNCQQLLASLWYEGLPGFRRRHIVFKVLLTVSVCLLYPILSLVYLVLPKSSLGHFMRRPFIKFICHSASYMTFLFLLILASQRIESIINLGGGENDQNKKMTREVRGVPPTSIEWMIIAYVAGLVWAEIKQLYDTGAKAYMQDMWNILDFITNSLYIATFTLKLVAYLRVEEEKRNNDPSATIKREFWNAFDPNLISEGLFAAANIFSTLKLIYMFTVNPHLGPLQISLGRMVMDVMKFAFIAILVVFSYACGVNQLYWYYAEERSKECEACKTLAGQDMDARADCDCDRTLANLFEILQTLYFAIYGLVDIKHFELKEDHEFTQFVGKTMFGTYSCIMIVVLLNMLIAMLSNSYQNIWNDADTEWKYARSKLWMSYFEEGGTVPAPFNVIPTPKTIWYCVKWLKDSICRCSKHHKRSKWQSIRKLVKKVNERESKYQTVMRDLIKRYIMQRQKAGQTEGVTEDDLNEIKQDISSFRYELLEILRNNGMKTPSTNLNQGKSKGGKLRRKGSRMSMERYKRQMKPSGAAISEGEGEGKGNGLPGFLKKTASNLSQDSTSSKNKDSYVDAIVEQTELDGGKMKGKKTESNGSDSQSSSPKKDEGLGESFEQSESESSLNSKSNLNGIKNAAYDAVPEELVSEDGSLREPRGSGSQSDKGELPLDASKLPKGDAGAASGSEHSSPRDDGGGSPDGHGSLSKKVSFYGSNDNTEGEEDAPVTETYVYRGKPKSRFGGRRRR